MPQDKKPSSPPHQPAEDMFGRPTATRHADPDAEARSREIDEAPTMDAQYACGPRPHKDDEECGSIDDLPDGDGLRSDLGKNPLPEHYWSAYPGGKPDGEK
jgi:hypothetical protein